MKTPLTPSLVAATFFGICLLVSCQGEQAGRAGIQNENWAQKASGMYMTQLPCPDCDTITFGLWVKPDHSYLARVTYEGVDRADKLNEGHYSFTGDSILVLEQLEEGLQYFVRSGNDLLAVQAEGTGMLNSDGQRIVLSKSMGKPIQSKARPEGGSDDFLKSLAAGGIDFYGRGTEPSWKLDIDFEGAFSFATLGEPSLNTPGVKGAPAMDADPPRTRYRAEVESGVLSFTIIAQSCTDQMSGEVFTHTVKVEVERNGEPQAKSFRGCGRYLPDYRLEGTWALESINGQAVDGADLAKGVPILRLDMKKLRYWGHAGCNNISGTFHMEKEALVMGESTGTVMACPNMDVEDAIKKHLADAQVGYDINGEQLVLKAPGGTTFRYVRQ